MRSANRRVAQALVWASLLAVGACFGPGNADGWGAMGDESSSSGDVDATSDGTSQSTDSDDEMLPLCTLGESETGRCRLG